MKLIIDKNEEGDITVQVEKDGNVKKFEYIQFINDIYNKTKIEAVIFKDSINQWEKDALNAIINQINELFILNDK